MKKALLAAVAFLLAVTLWWLVRGQARVAPATGDASKHPVSQEIVATPPYPRAEIQDPGTAKPAEAKKAVPIQPPSTEIIREEVAANPEVTPLSLLDFAESLAPKMREAVGDESKAKSFFDEMRTCVQAPASNIAETAQALCLKNALKLGEIHPALRDQADKLRSVAAPRLLRLIQ